MAAATTCFSLVSSTEASETGLPADTSKQHKTSVERAARQALLEKAHEKAAVDSAKPLCHGRVALFGLMLVAVVRALAWWDGNIPGGSVWGIHFLTTASDAVSMVFALPFFCTGTAGQCVQLGFVGPLMTLIFAMTVVDASALFSFLLVATPRPLPPGVRSLVDLAEACIGIWDIALFASVSLQIALLTSSWRVYKELRMQGLYPPGTLPAGMGKIEPVSILEVCCEIDDVKFLNEWEWDCSKVGVAKVVESTDTTAGMP